MPKFAVTYCSNCGGEFGPGDAGYSHCWQHKKPVDRLSSCKFCRTTPGAGEEECSTRDQANGCSWFTSEDKALFDRREAAATVRGATDQLVDAAKKALNYIENTESELGIKLDSGDALRAALAPSSDLPQCAARKQSLPDPADCNWPLCGCDPMAAKVIEALQESGLFPADAR
jgi:hypothetical protein